MVRKYSTDEIKNLIRLEATKQGVPVEIALAVAQQESGFNNLATNTNDDGSIDRGVMQLNSKYHKLKNWQDPMENIAYGIRHLKGLLVGAKGDVRKALSNYNAGANATGKKRKQGDAYAQKVMALMNKGNNGKVTGAAAPISATPDMKTTAETMADLYTGQISDAEKLLQVYFNNKGYDDTYFQKVKKQADEQIQKTKEALDKINTTASPEKIKEITDRMEKAKADYDADINTAMQLAERGIPSNKLDKYVNMFKATTRENIDELKAANPYTQMSKLAPVNLDDYARAVNRAQQTNAMIRANNIAMGGQAQPVDFGNEALQLAQARQAAEMARQTGLTPEQFIAARNMDYQAAGTALNNQQQVEAQLYNRAMAGDIDAYQQLMNMYQQRGANNLSYATNLTNQLQQEDRNALQRAEIQSQNERALLNARQQLYPNAISADAAMQQGNQTQTGATLRQGMSGGNAAANAYLNYEAMLQKADAAAGNGEITMKDIIEYNKPILSATGYSPDSDAMNTAITDYKNQIAAVNPQMRPYLFPEEYSRQGVQPIQGMSQWSNNSVNTFRQ